MLRRYRKRWKVEHLFAWMYNFRRLVTGGNTTGRGPDWGRREHNYKLGVQRNPSSHLRSR